MILKKNEIINLIAILLVVFGILLFLYTYISSTNECKRNPISYGIRDLEKRSGYSFIGYGFFSTAGSQLLLLNSTNVYQDSVPLY